MKSQPKSVANKAEPKPVDLNRRTETKSNLKTHGGEKGVGDYHGQAKEPLTPLTQTNMGDPKKRS